ncbi:MAG: glycosyltransferase family 4 protein [Clostridia bacterium]|nr:glycosyltransferase family 4 protein [Clostridia bacterium]
MKIYLDTIIFARQRFGGISNVWYEYVSRMLKDENVELNLFGLDNYINMRYMELNKENAKHLKDKKSNINILRLISPDIKSTEKCIFQSTDLRICKKKNVKNIVMIHDTTHQIYFKGIKKIINTYQKRKAIKNADGIVYISDNTRKDTNRFFKKSTEKMEKVIYNSASEDFCKLDKPELPERYKEVENKKYFIYVGDRTNYKNVDFLYRVLRENPHINAVIVGGKDFSEKELEELVDIKDRIYKYSKVPNDELNILYNKAFCSIYPSLYEGFGIPVLEAMKTGCPVIAFNNSSIPEVLKGTGILLENNDIEGCNEQIKKLEDFAYRKKIENEEIEKSKFFDWNKSYKELMDFYEEVLNNGDKYEKKL